MSVGPSSTAVTQAHSTDNHGSVGRGESSSLVETTSILQTLTRVLANVLAGSLVLLPVITLAVLIFQGMFKRLIMSENAQTTDFYWAEYSQSCVLRSSGWVDKTCEAKVSSIAPAPAFASIGRVLAQHWANGTAHAGGSLKISTCTIGGTDQVGWTNIIFIAGYDYFPKCLPTTPQDVAGMAMVETTIREEYLDGLYALVVYADMDLLDIRITYV